MTQWLSLLLRQWQEFWFTPAPPHTLALIRILGGAMLFYTHLVWGKNLLDELYVNGGFDTRDTWGYDFAIVGRSREVGVSIAFTF